MLSVEQFRARASVIYSGQRDREKKRMEKSLPKGVSIEILGKDILPYTRQEFYEWLWERVALQAIQCRYCSAPIDIVNLTTDHREPLKLGGSIGLDNQEPIWGMATIRYKMGHLLNTTVPATGRTSRP